MSVQKITTFLWYNDNAEDAAKLYVSLFKNSHITKIARYPEGAPAPAGSVMTVEFVLDGQTFIALNGGPIFKFTEAVSLVVSCADQAEIDHFWNGLIADGGQPSQCGWLKDKFGLSWQIVPSNMGELMAGPDPQKSQRAMAAMMTMSKLDIAALENA